ncbi:MAG: MCE family protein, partial [Chloroflexi bacterium]
TMRSRSAINIGVIAAFTGLCLLGLFYLAFNMGLERPGSSGTRIKANFALAEGLVTQDEVRIAGVKAGHVVAVDPASDGTTLVTTLLDPGIRVRRDTQAVVRPKSLLGTQLVQLNRKPGSNAPYLNEGETIPKAQTGEAVEVDSVLNNMDPPTRAPFSQPLQETTAPATSTRASPRWTRWSATSAPWRSSATAGKPSWRGSWTTSTSFSRRWPTSRTSWGSSSTRATSSSAASRPATSSWRGPSRTRISSSAPWTRLSTA